VKSGTETQRLVVEWTKDGQTYAGAFIAPDGYRWWEKVPASGVRLEWTERAGEVVELAAVSPFGDWALRVALAPGDDDEPTVTEVVLCPQPGGEPIGARRLRKLGFGAVVDAVNDWLSDPYLRERLGSPWTRPIPRPGRRGRADVEYARWARRYVEALAHAPRNPVKHLIDTAPADEVLTAGQVRWYLGEARKRGLLTDAPAGSAGGKLTAKARSLLAELDRVRDEKGKR
jgi:hypothetical protein